MGNKYEFMRSLTNAELFEREREVAEELGKMATGDDGYNVLWNYRFAVRRELYKRRAVTKHWLTGLC